MIWLHHFLLRFRPYQYFIDWTKTVILPGFRPLPLYTVVSFFFNELKQGALGNRASSLAFSFMLAVFPTIIFLFTLIPYIPFEGFQKQFLSLIQLILPTKAYQAFQSTIHDIVSNQNLKLLSFGFLSALYFATNGMSVLMKAFNKSSLQMETRTWLKRRWVALVLTLVLVISLVLAIGILVIGDVIIGFLKNHFYSQSAFWAYVITLTRWIIVLMVFFTTLSILYRYGPAHKQRWKFITPGSVLATFLGLLTSIAFAYYINNFPAYNKVYGSIGTLIVVMVWMHLNSLVILIGFELNASVELSKQTIKIVKPMYNSFKKPPGNDLKS
ncbi:MAG: YihY/virulence factor BrkB family protein [Sphingobacteriaceae bacterium]|nr:MAG: YihY/virulence factor BrkB family protein [Sphingobacteriaceae bacterium]